MSGAEEKPAADNARAVQPPAPVERLRANTPLLYRFVSIVEPFDPGSLFPTPQPVEVEIGSGDGSFLTTYAALRPDRNFAGVERLLGRLRKLDRKARRAGLSNVVGLRIEAAYFLEYLLPPASVGALHVYFPDPWPKKRHRQRRLVNERFPVLAGRALETGGVVYLRTDDPDYFDQMRRVFEAGEGFQAVETPPALAALLTDFEVHFRRVGKTSRRAAYRKVRAADAVRGGD